MTKKKEKCPYCGRMFVNLSRHKCPNRPDSESAGKPAATSAAGTRAGQSQRARTVRRSTRVRTQTTSASDKGISARRAGTAKRTHRRRSFSEIDKIVLELIKARREIFKDELLEITGLDEKTLDKSLERLKNKRKILKIPDVKEGIRVLRLQYIHDLVEKGRSSGKSDELSEWDMLKDCPCFLCPDAKICNPGQEEKNPIKCEYLLDWIYCSLEGLPYENPFRKRLELELKEKDK